MASWSTGRAKLGGKRASLKRRIEPRRGGVVEPRRRGLHGWGVVGEIPVQSGLENIGKETERCCEWR